LTTLIAFGGAPVFGQAEPDQTLDQVNANDANVVLDMAFSDPSAPEASVPDFTDLGVNGGGGISSCKISPRGLYCLATVTPALPDTPYQVVRYWEDPKARPSEFSDLLRCDSVLGLQVKTGVPGPCTGLTVDLAGAIWVTGSADGKNYALIKVVQASLLTSCSNSDPLWKPLTWPSGTTLCRAVYATGPGVLSDIDTVDTEEIIASASWPYDAVILGVRNNVSGGGGLASDVVMFDREEPASPLATPKVIFPSWGLAVGERLQSASVLQVPQSGSTPPVNYVLAATSVLAGTGTGRILARNAATPSGATTSAFNITGWETANTGMTINLGYSDWDSDGTGPLAGPCQGLTSCTILRGSTPVATLTSTGGTMARKTATGGAVGLGVNGSTGTTGEIDVNETINVTLAAPRKVSTIEVLFLYNGPEFTDRAEIARINADGVDYFLSMRATADDDAADWTGPGSVAKCGTATSSGTGCLMIINPFPGPVTSLTFGAQNAPPGVGGGTNNSDYSIGRIETAAFGVRSSWTTGQTYLSNRDYQRVIALATGGSATPFPLSVAPSTKPPGLPFALSTGTSTFPDGLSVAPGVPIDLTVDCPTPIDSGGNGGCTVAYAADGTSAAKLGDVTLASTSTASGVTVYKVKNLLDCRYQPQFQACYKLLNPSGGTVSDSAAQAALIAAGWIVPDLGASAADKLKPATQVLNVTPQLPEDVSAQFPLTGPGSLPSLYVSQRYRAPNERNYVFDALFFKTQDGVYFTGTYSGEFDVSKLTGGFELGCNPYPSGSNIANYFKWDAITTASETWIGVGGRYIDTLINVGCRNPTKVSGGRTSIFPILEIAPDTYGPTIVSSTPSVTPNNDGAFARLTQALYTELRSALDQYTCVQVDDTVSPIGDAPLSSTTCNNLRSIWSNGKQKLDKCVDAAFTPKASASNENCQSFRNKLDEYKAALPAAPSGLDLANRLAEQYYRWEVIKHVFETRFLPSIPYKKGYCRERYPAGSTSCPNTPL
jgi:hypothetical protein